MARFAVYAEPIQKDDYIVDYTASFLKSALLTPFLVPAYVYIDLRNIEHVVRKMPGKIDKSLWD
jgi:hypothetical protein